jgi:SlyX protein
MSENRLNDIETALAHQDNIIADLSDIINDQWKEIESLKRKLSETNDKIQDIENLGGDNNQANVKPPHW